MQLTINDFITDSQGRRFTDVVNDNRISFQAWLDFFNNSERQKRMQDSETHHDRPALAGVIKELEKNSAFREYLENNDAHTTRRGRQAIGVIVKIIMNKLGWKTTGVKGSLGSRVKVEPYTTEPGAHVNKSGLSKWFTKTERYTNPLNS